MRIGVVRDSNGMRLAGILLSGLGLILSASASCRQTSQTVPPDQYGPLYPATLRLKNGSPLLKIGFSSRGVQDLKIFDEPELEQYSPLSPRQRPPDRHLASSGAGVPGLTRGLALGDSAGPGKDSRGHLRHAGDRHGLHLLSRPQKACLSARRQIPVPSPASHGQESGTSESGAVGGMVGRLPAGEAGTRTAAGRVSKVTDWRGLPASQFPATS